MPTRTLNRLRRKILGRTVDVWYHPAYRLPVTNAESHLGMDPRRADFAFWYLADRRLVPQDAFHTPRSATYEELARVHTRDWLASLTEPESLAQVFSLHPGEVEVDELMHSVRLATGGTIEAARVAARTKRPTMNLLGGFHHASPDRGGGFCPVNDVAVAVKALRHAGWRGTVAVIDLDAHPPDGLSACFEGDRTVWIASLSGTDWGPLPNVDETVLPKNTGDEAYLGALRRLLSRMPRADLAFVLAGGDVLQGDKFGALALSLDGARQRDLLVADALDGTGSVWVPAGGYTQGAWRVLAGTGLALALRTRQPISENYDPIRARFARIARNLAGPELGNDPEELSFTDIEAALGLRPQQRHLLDYYTAEGAEHALWRYGILEQISRLGYKALRVTVDHVDQGDRLRVFGSCNGEEHLLIEAVLEKKRVRDRSILFIHWLTLRHPRAAFETGKPRLPGQDVPGLGLAREASEMFRRMSERLDLDGVGFRPSWYHMAYTGRRTFSFADSARQGRFEAMQRDFRHLSLLETTLAVTDGRVLLNGKPYQWEADEMLYLHGGARVTNPKEVAQEKERAHFTLAPNTV